MTRRSPTPQELREFLRYEPKTGKLFWKPRDVSFFKTDRACNSWNAKYENKEALTACKSGGYRHGCILSRQHLAHRVAWALHHGVWPSDQIDHINGDTADNRILNLRVVTPQENQMNTKMRRNNTSGVMGVGWRNDMAKWAANIQIEGRRKHLGLFEDKSDAIAARSEAEAQYNFHENHGRLS